MTDTFDEKARVIVDRMDADWSDSERIIAAALREAVGEERERCLKIAADVCARYRKQNAIEVAASEIHDRIAAVFIAPPED